MVGEHHALLDGEAAEREPDGALAGRPRQAEGQTEVDGELEVHVEELRAQLQRAHVAVEVADVEAPEDRPLHLGTELPAYLVQVGVVPHIGDRAGEAAIAVEQGGSVGDRAPSVRVVLGVEGEVHPDVLASVAGGRVACPRTRHHERGAGGDAVAKGGIDAHVGGMAGPEVVAVDDQQAIVRPVSQPLGE